MVEEIVIRNPLVIEQNVNRIQRTNVIPVSVIIKVTEDIHGRILLPDRLRELIIGTALDTGALEEIGAEEVRGDVLGRSLPPEGRNLPT